MTDNACKVAIAGLGTVGAETVRLIAAQKDLLAARSGREIRVTAVSARDRNRDRGLDLAGIEWFDDAAEMAVKADADIVVEVIGGEDGKARETIDNAIATGKRDKRAAAKSSKTELASAKSSKTAAEKASDSDDVAPVPKATKPSGKSGTASKAAKAGAKVAASDEPARTRPTNNQLL